MAESVRRSDVKKFIHATKQTKAARPLQPSLFGDTLSNARREWDCICNSNVIPSNGSTVFVQVRPGKNPDVLLGNQVVAEITDALASELTNAICASAQGGGIAATIVSSEIAHGQIIIRLETG